MLPACGCLPPTLPLLLPPAMPLLCPHQIRTLSSYALPRVLTSSLSTCSSSIYQLTSRKPRGFCSNEQIFALVGQLAVGAIFGLFAGALSQVQGPSSRILLCIPQVLSCAEVLC